MLLNCSCGISCHSQFKWPFHRAIGWSSVLSSREPPTNTFLIVSHISRWNQIGARSEQHKKKQTQRIQAAKGVRARSLHKADKQTKIQFQSECDRFQSKACVRLESAVAHRRLSHRNSIKCALDQILPGLSAHWSHRLDASSTSFYHFSMGTAGTLDSTCGR